MDLKPHITTLSGARLEIASKSNDMAIHEVQLEIVNNKLKKEKKQRRNRTADLVVANKEFLVKSNHKLKRAKKFKKETQELLYQLCDKAQREKDLTIAHRTLTIQSKYLKQLSSKLRATNRTLIKEHKNNDKLAQEFMSLHKELLKAQSNQKAYVEGLSELMDMISHKLRQPVVQIMGLTSLVSTEKAFTDNIEMIALIKESASNLDCYTKELTELIHIQEIHATQLATTYIG